MKIVGIISAMEEEMIALRRKIELQKIHHIAGMDFYEAMLKDMQVIMVKCENGKVNAAVCTQILMDRFQVQAIMSIGLAAGLHPSLNIGDIILASDTEQMIEGSINEEKEFWERNQHLIQCSKEIVGTTLKEGQMWIGQIDSQNEYLSGIKVKEKNATTFTIFCAEMEGIAIAHVCAINKIPFMIVRTISDTADNEQDISFEDFVNGSARYVSKMVQKTLEVL